MLAILMGFTQIAGIGEPSVSTVAIAFAGVCALWLIGETV